MPLNKEGFKMDPKLAETMARIKAEHPAPAVDAANDSHISEQVATTPVQKKKKPRHFVTFIERSLPPRDRE